MMSNIPSDLIEDAKEAGLDTGKHDTVAMGTMHDLQRFASIRDARAKSSVASDDREAFEAWAKTVKRLEGLVYNDKFGYNYFEGQTAYEAYLQGKANASKQAQSTEVANALEIAAKACDELGKSYGDRGYKAHPRSSDGIYDKCKAGKEASLLCAERVRNLITTQPTQSAAPTTPNKVE